MRKRLKELVPTEGLRIERKYFLVHFLLLLANLSSLSIFIVNIPPLRYLRQPSLILALAAVWHFFPPQQAKKGFQIPAYLYFFFCLYMVFNTLTSINISNTASYGAWMLAFYLFFYQFLVLRNGLRFREMLFQFTAAAGMVGGFFIVVSYIGGYVLGIESFFDERYNYTLMRMTTEFAGVFGSNNSFGIITWLTSVFLLLLFELLKDRPVRWWFLGGSAFLTILLFFIGNRASMACGVACWTLYFVWGHRSVLGTIGFAMALFFGGIYFQDVLLQKLRLEQFEGGNVLGNRSTLIDEALAVVDEMDFFGVGYHNQKLSRKYFDLVADDDKEYNFHNTYLATFTELGYVGFLWVPGIVILMLLRPPASKKEPDEARIIRLLKSILLIMLVFYLPVEDSVNSPGSPTFIIFWTFFFLLVIGLSEGPKPMPEHETNRLPDHPVPGS